MKIDRPPAPDQNTTQLGVAPLPRNGTGILSLPEDRRGDRFIFRGTTLPRKTRDLCSRTCRSSGPIFFLFQIHHFFGQLSARG